MRARSAMVFITLTAILICAGIPVAIGAMEASTSLQNQTAGVQLPPTGDTALAESPNGCYSSAHAGDVK
jgi:hypothetical protein